MELPLTSDQVALNGWTCAMDGHVTKNAHELFFGDLAMHNLCLTNPASTQVP